MTVVNLALSSFSTTGTIVGGTNSLVVASASGFSVNDRLIIEIGGESGAGARGTGGVGGSWPNLGYPNLATMTADTGQPDGKYAYLVDTSNVYRSFSGMWTQVTGGDTYYVQKRIPRGLFAKISAKVGTTLMLVDEMGSALNATVTATNANVYFDNVYIINATTEFGSGVADGSEVILPAGRFAISDAIQLSGHNNWDFHGTSATASTVFFPEGISSICTIGGSSCNNLQLHDFGMEGNARAQGYMMYFLPGSETFAWYNEGIKYSTACDSIVISDVKAVDCFKTFSLESGCNNAICQRIEAVLTEGYGVEEWHISANDCLGVRYIDITVTSATWIPGFEFFRCSGSSMIGCSGTNAFVSINTDDDWLLQDMTIVINGADRVATTIFTSNSPIVDINDNIGDASVSAGGRMNNITVTQNGTVSPGNDTLRGINVAIKNTGIVLDGATITLPDYVMGSSLVGAVGFASDAANTSVRNFTCHGTTSSGSWANLMLGGANSTYRNIDVDSNLGGIEVDPYVRVGAKIF